MESDHSITSEAALRAMFPPTHEIAKLKCLDHFDHYAQEFIAKSPFLCLGTQNGAGSADVSPRGGAAGFAAVLDHKTLAIPDRPGNNRLDSLSNILANPSVGILFLIPGFDETMRVNGLARLTTAPDILTQLPFDGNPPRLAIIVSVSEVFIHCAKALRRSQLWNAALHQDRATMPSLMQIILDQTTGAPTPVADLQRLDAALEDEYQKSM